MTTLHGPNPNPSSRIGPTRPPPVRLPRSVELTAPTSVTPKHRPSSAASLYNTFRGQAESFDESSLRSRPPDLHGPTLTRASFSEPPAHAAPVRRPAPPPGRTHHRIARTTGAECRPPPRGTIPGDVTAHRNRKRSHAALVAGRCPRRGTLGPVPDSLPGKHPGRLTRLRRRGNHSRPGRIGRQT